MKDTTMLERSISHVCILESFSIKIRLYCSHQLLVFSGAKQHHQKAALFSMNLTTKGYLSGM